MPLPNEPPAWQVNPSDIYIPIRYENKIVGYCKPIVASRIIDLLNDEERLYKALRLACYDLVGLSGGSTESVEHLTQTYLAKAARPTSGTAAIAHWLKHRQEELDVSDREFERFCDSYRLPKEKLQAIYDGHDIEASMLTPLARILGCSTNDIMQVLEG